MYYSMFGFQRVGDMIWAFADSRGKGFLMGGTAGRTTMLGEGLQHQDGHSHVLLEHRAHLPELRSRLMSTSWPSSCRTASAACTKKGETVFYYITMYNEDYADAGDAGRASRRHPARYLQVQASGKGKASAHLFGSGPILNEALRAQQILAEKYGVPADVWSVTSYNELRRDALAVERWNRLHPRRSRGKTLHPQRAQRRGGADRRRHRLHEVGAGSAGAVAAG